MKILFILVVLAGPLLSTAYGSSLGQRESLDENEFVKSSESKLAKRQVPPAHVPSPPAVHAPPARAYPPPPSFPAPSQPPPSQPPVQAPPPPEETTQTRIPPNFPFTDLNFPEIPSAERPKGYLPYGIKWFQAGNGGAGGSGGTGNSSGGTGGPGGSIIIYANKG